MKVKEIKEPDLKINSFPSESLMASLDLVSKINDSRGEVISSIKQIAIATGIGEGTLILPISTACQYGIFENIHGEGYRSTDLYTKIKSYTFESDRDEAIFEALSNPLLYKKILNEFNGKTLPNPTGFANYLSATLRFKPYAVPKIIKAFYKNFSGYIDGNNKLRFQHNDLKPGNVLVKEPEPKKLIPENEVTELVLSVKSTPNLFEQPVPMPNAKMIVLKYPKGNMDREDFVALRSFIDFLELTEVRGMKEIKKENE